MNEFTAQLIGTVLLILAILKNSFTFNPMRFTCKNYLLNAYLYIFLSLVLIFLTIDIYEEEEVPSIFEKIQSGFLKFIIYLFLSLGLLWLVLITSPEKIISKHLIWLLWIATMAYILYPLMLKNSNLFSQVKLITAIVLTILTLFTFWKPELVSLSWGSTLLIILLGLILVQVIGFIFPSFYTSYTSYIVSYISLILFSFFMLWDTKLLIIKAKQCVKADYINDSLGVVLNGLNIFAEIFSIKSQ